MRRQAIHALKSKESQHVLLETAIAASNQPIYWENLGLRPGIELGFFTLRWYSLAYLTGIIFGYWHLSRMIKAPGAPLAQRHAEDLFFWCTLGIIIGGRLGYATFYEPSLWTGWTDTETVSWDLLRLWDGGMSFHGGLIGVLLAIAWVSWRGKLNFIRVCDYVAVNVPAGLALGRVANFINGELWGRPAGEGVPWAMVFPTAGPLARHPSQLYEALLEGVVLLAILLILFWKTRARWRPGLLVGVFTLGYGLARFTVEFFREPDAQLEEFAAQTGFSMGQWLTMPMILIGLVLIAVALKRPPQHATRATAPAA
ncbi:prolipoprotein diacylglyceryl transferase [Croceicoccus mobilis]|uniref:Phosphatidylglycerol--prolipoprotein diacylglyceryl transferase n=1 Tax=Croceicoccus mobilis TaxID=1703339 RepID=A0A917DUU9_9SPHN|nr:prolipoprotein diacylglyceryl transferase [Croceicoccus mobilis]GGD71025.1 prolipoprotein diacylglyceryl transferase [Croceicoccus mobilis]